MPLQALAILVVHALAPAVRELILKHSPGELQPLAIEERTASVGFADPQHHRRIVCDRTKKSVSVESRGVAHLSLVPTRDPVECPRTSNSCQTNTYSVSSTVNSNR